MNDIPIPLIFKECSIEMSVNPGDNKSVTLLPHDKTLKQSLDMVLFRITNFDLVNATFPGEGIRMTITLKRKIMSEMMTTYFPSLLLMMITYATTFFKPSLVLVHPPHHLFLF